MFSTKKSPWVSGLRSHNPLSSVPRLRQLSGHDPERSKAYTWTHLVKSQVQTKHKQHRSGEILQTVQAENRCMRHITCKIIIRPDKTQGSTMIIHCTSRSAATVKMYRVYTIHPRSRDTRRKPIASNLRAISAWGMCKTRILQHHSTTTTSMLRTRQQPTVRTCPTRDIDREGTTSGASHAEHVKHSPSSSSGCSSATFSSLPCLRSIACSLTAAASDCITRRR